MISRETISTRRNHPTLAELDVGAANNNAPPHGEEQTHEASGLKGSQLEALVSVHDPFHMDSGYAEAMRLWCEEKENENETLEAELHERKVARRPGTA